MSFVTIAYNVNTDKNLVCICTLIFGLVARSGSTKWRVRHPPFSYGEIDERIMPEDELRVQIDSLHPSDGELTFDDVLKFHENQKIESILKSDT